MSAGSCSGIICATVALPRHCQPVRAALHLEPGDELVYEITDGYVILTKARARASGRTDDPFRTFHEWSTEADAKAYAEL